MKTKSIFKWELIGFFVISILGTLFHFGYEWSGHLKPLAIFLPVNESVWEHLKMGFWPALFYALLEYFAFGRDTNNFWPAKTAALYALPLVIVVVFYSLKNILGEPRVWMDIANFFLAITISQLISYKILTNRVNYRNLTTLCLVLLLFWVAAFSLLTYFPPKLEPFLDHTTGTYGIPKK